MDRQILSSPELTAVVSASGGELCSLRDRTGYELLWQARAPWHRHAPNLFPIVGRLKNHTLRHRGNIHHLTQHGFARDKVFSWQERSDTSCQLALHDDDETRAAFPFPFLLSVSYALADDKLMVTYIIENPGDDLLPAAIGAHPGFIWPLSSNIAKEAHFLRFSSDETEGIRRVEGGLLLPDRFPSPVRDRMLLLSPDLFIDDAIIFDRPASTVVTYTAPGAHAIEIARESGFRELGVWSREQAEFLCLEPWCGMASPVGFDGEILDKPGMLLIPPRESRTAAFSIRVLMPDKPHTG